MLGLCLAGITTLNMHVIEIRLVIQVCCDWGWGCVNLSNHWIGSQASNTVINFSLQTILCLPSVWVDLRAASLDMQFKILLESDLLLDCWSQDFNLKLGCIWCCIMSLLYWCCI